MSQPPQSPTTSSPSPPAPSEPADRPKTESTPAPASAPTAPPPAEEPAPGHTCQWVGCDKVLPDPEALYNHLCNDHIGRKSTGNLCLTCKWKDCGTTCAKRDHITSHLRVHTPLKPHVCEICKKPFKRPQDLKKHEKIHTEEHHAQHKHSKAITVSDPAYSQRVRGESDRSRTLAPPPNHHVPVARAKSSSVSLSDSSSGPDFGVLPTPSPELDYSPEAAAAHSRSQMYRVQQQLPTWEVLTDDIPHRSIPVSGSKRGYDYAVDEFFSDVKKRRVTPAYDPHMAARLSNLAYHQSLSATTNGAPPPGPAPPPSFPPRSVSFDIRTPEELAAVNEFLITLGRDVSASASHPSRHQHSQSVPHASVEESSFFDPANLAQLGLAGMPGVPASAPGPGSGAGYHGESGFMPLSEFSHHGPSYPSRSSQHHTVPSVQFGLYPSAQDIAGPAGPLPYAGQRIRAHRASATDMDPSPPFPPHINSHNYPHYLTPPLDLGPAANPVASPLSSHSGMSTPPSATPPHIPLTVAPESAAMFDFVRTGRAPPPVVQLAPVEYSSKSMRTVIPLKSAGPSASAAAAHASSQPSTLGVRPEPVEPKLGMGAVHRGLPARLTASAASSSIAASKSNNPLYPLLTSGDEEFRLPPLGARFRSPSPTHSASTVSREPTLSPTLTTTSAHRSPSPLSDGSSTTTPSPMHSVASTPSPPLVGSTVAYPTLPPLSALASDVGRLELDKGKAVTPEERRKHAQFLRDLLVAINLEYRRKFGTPPPPPAQVQVQARAQQGMAMEPQHVHVQEVRGIEREVRDVEMIAV
ncbi:hypothetical protein C8Q76DRAFT_618792 [Earliella scabrosa]|nr:hypothetical protein C8Q76DRAFT_618792 [Earliella scabrosa]